MRLKHYLYIVIAALLLLQPGISFAQTGLTEIPGNSATLALTTEERAFLAGRRLRLGVDSARPPFEYIDSKGVYSGISAGYIEACAKKLGITVVPVPGLTVKEAADKVKIGEIDVIPKITPTDERRKYLLFTQAYATFPSVIITRKDTRFVGGLDDLEGLKVGVLDGLVVQELLTRDYPKLPLISLPDVRTALLDLSTGKIDVFIDNLGTVSYNIEKLGLTNLKIAAPTPYNHDLAFGVRKDWPLLASALNKALTSMSSQEKIAIKGRWLSVQYQMGVNWKTIGPIGAALLIVIAFVLIWNRRLRRAVFEREAVQQQLQKYSRELESSNVHTQSLLEATREQAEKLKAQQEQIKETEIWYGGIIESAPDGMLVVDEDGMIILTNVIVEKIFDYGPGELLGENVDILVPSDVRDSHRLLRQSFMQAGVTSRQIGQSLNLRGTRKDGSEFPVEIGLSTLPAMGSRGRCACASIRDITERRALEESLKQQMDELERFNRLTINREDKMIQLKEEINNLLVQSGKDKKYKIVT